MDKYNYFFLDTEFVENGITIDPISVGIVAEDGSEFYRINADCDFAKASDWVKENVLKPMGITVTKDGLVDIDTTHPDNVNGWAGVNQPGSKWITKDQFKHELVGFIGKDTKPKFIGYYCDYDWVLTAQLFGTMMELPSNFPMHMIDLKQYVDDLNIDITKLVPDSGHHNALGDAKWTKQAYNTIKPLL